MQPLAFSAHKPFDSVFITNLVILLTVIIISRCWLRNFNLTEIQKNHYKNVILLRSLTLMEFDRKFAKLTVSKSVMKKIKIIQSFMKLLSNFGKKYVKRSWLRTISSYITDIIMNCDRLIFLHSSYNLIIEMNSFLNIIVSQIKNFHSHPVLIEVFKMLSVLLSHWINTIASVLCVVDSPKPFNFLWEKSITNLYFSAGFFFSAK